MFRGHRIQHATAGVAAIHRGWVVFDVVVMGRRKRGAGSITADNARYSAGSPTKCANVSGNGTT
jgi:hypothetical protein